MPVLFVYFVSYYIEIVFSSFSAPLTDKPPKILFPSENKISNMELQLGKSIMGFPPPAECEQSVLSVLFANDRKRMTLQILFNAPPGAEHRLMMALLFACETAKEKTIVKVFSICKWWVLMSLRLFCQQ